MVVVVMVAAAAVVVVGVILAFPPEDTRISPWYLGYCISSYLAAF